LQVEKKQQRQASYAFKQSMIGALNDNKDKLSLTRAHQRFTINQRKAQLADLIDISENDIPLQNMGKGKESLVKTELSLDSKASLVMIEEPENHLSYSNTRKMIAQINDQSNNAQQVIVTTHESMVLNRLNLDCAIWIRDSKGESLEDLGYDDAEFFKRNDDFDILKFILADKVILVEGASEYITAPAITKKVLGKDVDELGVSVLSLHGIHYKHFFALAKRLNKRVLILTDNDGSKNESIDEQNAETSDNICIQTPSDPDIFTFEVALDQVNPNLTEEYRMDYHPKSTSTSYKKMYTNLSKALACALANKTEFAIYVAKQFEKNDSGVRTPAYIEEGLKWLQKSN
jgi:predicted ATP-dependent endonuclease of OLD family